MKHKNDRSHKMAWWVWLVCLLAVWARAETVEISSVAQWNTFVRESCASGRQWNVTLQADIDFTGSVFTPVGMSDSGECTPFRGSFDGMGHSVHGIVPSGDNVGLFCCLEDATVSNLVVGRSCSFVGRGNAGVLAPRVTGSLRVCNVTSRALVSGTNYVGGLVAVAEGLSKKALVFESVTNDGVMNGTASCIGGFLGRFALSNNTNVSISHSTVNCVFNITAESNAGGFLALAIKNNDAVLSFTESASVMDITFFGPSQASLGGFIGSLALNNNDSITISRCKRAGDISAITTTNNESPCLAGIIAKVRSGHNTNLTIVNTTSIGQITFGVHGSHSYIGGILGFVSELNGLTATFRGIISQGPIITTQRNENNHNHVGGFVASFQKNTDMFLEFDECKNKRSIESNLSHGMDIFSSGFIADFREFNNGTLNMNNLCNYGNISLVNGATTYAGGFIGQMISQGMIVNIRHTINYGSIYTSVTAYNGVGGFVGSVESKATSKVTFNNCFNFGDIISESSADLGGFVGSINGMKQDPLIVVLTNCANNGTLVGNHVSGFFNQNSKEEVDSSVINSINSGTVSGNVSYGIATNVTKGYNIVLLNSVNGANYSEPFWDNASGDSLFCDSSFCSESKAIVRFVQSANGLHSVINDSSKRIDDLLNWNAEGIMYGMMWTSQLNLVDESINVTFSGIFNLRWLIKKR